MKPFVKLKELAASGGVSHAVPRQGRELPSSPLLSLYRTSLPPFLSGKSEGYPISPAFPSSHLALARLSVELKLVKSAPLERLAQRGAVTARSQRWEQAEQGRDAAQTPEQDVRHGAGGKFTASGSGSGPPFYYI